MTEDIPGFERPPLPPFQTLAEAHTVCDANIARINVLTHRVNTLSEKLARIIDAHNALIVAHDKLTTDHDKSMRLIFDKYVPLYRRGRITDALWIERLIRHFRIQERNMTRLWTAVMPLVRKHNPALAKSLKLERGPQERPIQQLIEEEIAREPTPLAAPAPATLPETPPATTN